MTDGSEGEGTGVSRMFFRILCWSGLLDYIDGGVCSFFEGGGVREEINKSSV